MKKLALLPLFIIAAYFAVPLKLPESQESVQIVDRDQKLLRMLSNKGNSFQSLLRMDDLPKELVTFILHAEDKDFYQHYGIDLSSMFRAIYQNMVQQRIVSGASTIDQQVVRVLQKYPRNWPAKFLVMFDALKLNVYNSKSQILNFYLNNLPYGHRITGVNEAAYYLFNKEVTNLNTDEMSVLAILPRSPSRLLRNQELLISKRNQLLKELDVETLNPNKITFDFTRRSKTAPHFTRFLLEQCQDKCSKNKIVESSLDLQLQSDLQLLVKDDVELLNKKNVGAAAVLVVDNLTGEILSYIGSHDFFAENGGEIDGIRQLRQPGSTLKPFTYALAFQNDHHASSILPDIETDFNVGGGIYRPKNYSNKYLGPVRASFALVNSLNIPALYLANYYSPEKLQHFLESFQLNFAHSSKHYGVGLTLGNAELSLFDLVQAYTSFPRRGELVHLTPFKTQVGQSSQTQLNPQVADLVSEILSENHRREHAFGRWNNLNFPFQFSAKTGTSTNFRDNWVVGFNQRFTVGVWVGNFDNKQMTNVSGISGAGKIFQKVVQEVYKKYPSQPRPINLVKRNICLLSGELAGEYCEHTAIEHYLDQNEPDKTCTFHKQIVVNNCHEENDFIKIKVVDLDHKEKFWRQYTNISNVEDQIANICSRKFKIVNSIKHAEAMIEFKSPQSGAFYAIDPIIPRDQQKLHFEILTNVRIKSITWELDDKFLGISQDEFKWQLEKGARKLKASVKTITGETIVKEVTFHVL